MNNKKKVKVFLYSSILFLLITCMVAGISYALFTDEVKVENHLVKSGNLDIALKRTALEYTQLDSDGYLQTGTNNNVVDFTETNLGDQNIFDLNDNNNTVVPGSYFTAKLVLENRGNVAFDYTVEIKMLTEDGEAANALASQLKVTITDEQGNVVGEPKMLSELNDTQSCVVNQGHMKGSETSHTFNVKVEFVDVAENNDAKSQEAAFDLIVSAVQATTPAATTPAETTNDANSSGSGSNEPN